MSSISWSCQVSVIVCLNLWCLDLRKLMIKVVRWCWSYVFCSREPKDLKLGLVDVNFIAAEADRQEDFMRLLEEGRDKRWGGGTRSRATWRRRSRSSRNMREFGEGNSSISSSLLHGCPTSGYILKFRMLISTKILISDFRILIFI